MTTISGAAFRRLRLAYGISQTAYARARGRADRGYTARLEGLAAVDDDHMETLSQLAGRDLLEPSVVADELSRAMERTAEADRLVDDELERGEDTGGRAKKAAPPDSAGGGFISFLREQVTAREQRVAALEAELARAREAQMAAQISTLQAVADVRAQMAALQLQIEHDKALRTAEARLEAEALRVIEQERGEGAGLADVLRVMEVGLPVLGRIMGLDGVGLSDRGGAPQPPLPLPHAGSVAPTRRPPVPDGMRAEVVEI